MKERLVEDWLSKINERGYEVAFCQLLISKGLRIVRCGHSPTEHGKDVLAIALDGSVHAYQLKTGDFAQGDVTKYHDQLNMLVETRPIFPGLPELFDYRPFLVTTGEFKDPAISLIKELNAGWEHRKLPSLGLINGRQLHVDLAALSFDFWPVKSPAIRRFRELYLVEGKGDLDIAQYAQFLIQILYRAKSGLDLERRVSAANIFASYLLGEFYEQGDHFSIFQGWTVCAAQIAYAGESSSFSEKHWKKPFEIAKEAAICALRCLAEEVLNPESFFVRDRELDQLTRTRNTVALAGAACSHLIANMSSELSQEALQGLAAVSLYLIEKGRLTIWGEGAIPQFLIIFWLLERANKGDRANALLISLIEVISLQNANDSEAPLEDPYFSPDDCLCKKFKVQRIASTKKTIESYSLLALVLIATRRDLRLSLEGAWPQISQVTLRWFEPTASAEALKWHCEEGQEKSCMFSQPQSWKELLEIAYRDSQEFLPQVIRKDLAFGLLFVLAFPHRFTPRLIKHVDTLISSPAKKAELAENH